MTFRKQMPLGRRAPEEQVEPGELDRAGPGICCIRTDIQSSYLGCRCLSDDLLVQRMERRKKMMPAMNDPESGGKARIYMNC